MFERCKAKVEKNIYDKENNNKKLILVNIRDPEGITIKSKAIYHYRAGNKMFSYLKEGDFIEFDDKFEAGELEMISNAKIKGGSWNNTFVNIGIVSHPKKRRYYTRLANGDLIELKCDKYGLVYGYPDSVKRNENYKMRSKDKLDVFFDIKA